MNWRTKRMRFVKRNSYNRTKCTMVHWRTYCWDWKVNHTDELMQYVEANVVALITIVCPELWRRLRCKLEKTKRNVTCGMVYAYRNMESESIQHNFANLTQCLQDKRKSVFFMKKKKKKKRRRRECINKI